MCTCVKNINEHYNKPCIDNTILISAIIIIVILNIIINYFFNFLKI